MDELFDLDEARAARDRVGLLAQRHEIILGGFWNPERKTFGQHGPDEREDHVTTACTCVLSFLDVPSGLPHFMHPSAAFVDWLMGAKWSSEELLDPNVYTAPLALTALRQLDPERLSLDKPERQVVFLLDELQRSGSGVCFEAYPPSGFLTYWTIRAIWDVVDLYTRTKWRERSDESNRSRQLIKQAVDWAEREVWRQFSFFTMNDLDRFDPLQMAYVMALVDFSREKTGKRPDENMIAKGLDILFKAQLSNGLWAKAFPIFHYRGYGSVYPFAFETLTTVMRMGFRQPVAAAPRYAFQVFRPHVRALLRTLAWAEANELNSQGLIGWRSNVAPGDTPQAWATSMVLSFARGLDFLLHRIVRERLLDEFDTDRPARLGTTEATSETWTRLADSDTRLDGKAFSLKQIVFERLVRPHFESRDAKSRVWSAIFFGPPGTAKTSLASEIATFLGWPLVTIQTSDFLAQGSDRMAYQARQVFRRLSELSEAVVLIDEVEEFVRNRTTEDRQARLVTTAMLTLLQDLHEKRAVILIMATNHIEDFDPAIRRPGRVDLVLYVPPPSVGAKKSLLVEALNSHGLELSSDADEDFAQPVGRAIVERFTFDEWRRFVADCCDVVRETRILDNETLVRLLKKRGGSLTISEQDWSKWMEKETYINV